MHMSPVYNRGASLRKQPAPAAARTRLHISTTTMRRNVCFGVEVVCCPLTRDLPLPYDELRPSYYRVATRWQRRGAAGVGCVPSSPARGNDHPSASFFSSQPRASPSATRTQSIHGVRPPDNAKRGRVHSASLHRCLGCASRNDRRIINSQTTTAVQLYNGGGQTRLPALDITAIDVALGARAGWQLHCGLRLRLRLGIWIAQVHGVTHCEEEEKSNDKG